MLSTPGHLHMNGLCAGSRSMTEHQLKYLRGFVDTFYYMPLLGMAVINVITHGDVSNEGLVDELLIRFYQRLSDKGHLNKSPVMFFSDHKAPSRETSQTLNGILKSKNPFRVLSHIPTLFHQEIPSDCEEFEDEYAPFDVTSPHAPDVT